MNTEQFYPTPRKLLESIFSDTDWKRIGTVLEPSAGNGERAIFQINNTLLM